MRVIIFFFLLITAGCGQYRSEVILISDYVQSVDESTSYDLNFRLHEIEYEGYSIASDSISSLLRQVRADVDNLGYTFYSLSTDFENDEMHQQMVEAKNKLDESWWNDINDLDEVIDGLNVIEDFILASYGRNESYYHIMKLKQYYAAPDSIIGHIYSVSYEIDEPVLKVRKTVQSKFVLNSNLTAVLGKIN